MSRAARQTRSERKGDDTITTTCSRGTGAVAIDPPAYGIDFVDRLLMPAPSSTGSRAISVPPPDTAGPLQFGPCQGSDRPETVAPVPPPLQSKFEASSGEDLSGVRVHRGSSQPSRFQALAFARGDDIHLAKGQESHLPHELWHVVQQRQGRVLPTRNIAGTAVNDDPRLEWEASQAGAGGLPREGAGRSASTAAAGAVLQRVVAPAGATIQAWDATDAQLGVIAAAVNLYNATAGTEVTAADFQASFANLQQVERAIYGWFRLKSRLHQELRLIPNYPQVRGLLDSASAEHESLVDRTLNMRVLPFDTAGMARDEVRAARRLWRSMMRGSNDIQILGSQAYQRRIRSELGKIMSTPTGRQLLTYLNTPKPHVVQGTANADLYKIYIGERVADLPQHVINASPGLMDQNRSESQPLNIDENTPGRKLQDITEAVESDADASSSASDDLPVVTRAGLSQVRDIVLSGGAGYEFGGKQYRFSNPGTGSFVTSFPGLSLMGGRTAGNQILDPSWLTLGHELGHSANMKAAATQVGHKAAVDDAFLAGLAGGTQAAKKWTNAEELLNIKNVENALREEADLSPRVGHQPPQWAQNHAVQVRRDLKAPLDALYIQDRHWYDHPNWNRLEQKYRTLPMQACHDPAVVQACYAERDEFLNLWTVGPVNAPTGGNGFFKRWKASQNL